jgi:hypothetical protein
MDIENEIATYLLHICYNITVIAKNVTNSGFMRVPYNVILGVLCPHCRFYIVSM